MNRRVVITGMGAVTPLGNTAADFWAGIREGKNGIDTITHFDISVQKAIMGGEVKDFTYEDFREGKQEAAYDKG